jgi:hypothetical protein
MAAKLFSRVLDNGLTVLDTEATGIYLTDSEPTDYADATTVPASGGSMIASKNFGAGAAFGAPQDRTPSGRKVASVAISDGSVAESGIAAYWAVCDVVNERLLARGTLSESQSFTAGNSFSLPSFEIGIPAE